MAINTFHVTYKENISGQYPPQVEEREVIIYVPDNMVVSESDIIRKAMQDVYHHLYYQCDFKITLIED